MENGQYKIYKSLGAAQFKLILPRRNEKGFIQKDGAVLVEVAPGIGTKNEPDWDWNKKIKFALGIPDLQLLIESDGTKRLTHDHDGSIKTFQFAEATDPKYAGTYMLKVTEGENRITVPVSGGEFLLLMKMLVQVAPTLIGW